MLSPLVSIADIYTYRELQEEQPQEEEEEQQCCHSSHTTILYVVVTIFAVLAITALLFALL